MQKSTPSIQYPVLLLIPTTNINVNVIRQAIQDIGLNARYNVGPIPQSLPKTFAPVGRMIFPISIQESIFGPLDAGDCRDFDISKYWDQRCRKDIKENGQSEHLIVAVFASRTDIESLDIALQVKDSYVWHWHQWVLFSRLDQMHWTY